MAQFSIKLFNLCSLHIVAESDTDTMGTSTGSTPDTMQVAFGFIRETEIDNCFNIRNIETTSHKICCEKVIHITSLKLFDGIHSLLLSKVSIDFNSLKFKDFEEKQHAMTLYLLIEENYNSLLETLQDKVK